MFHRDPEIITKLLPVKIHNGQLENELSIEVSGLFFIICHIDIIDRTPTTKQALFLGLILKEKESSSLEKEVMKD